MFWFNRQIWEDILKEKTHNKDGKPNYCVLLHRWKNVATKGGMLLMPDYSQAEGDLGVLHKMVELYKVIINSNFKNMGNL